MLRGRSEELEKCIHHLRYGGAAPFIYGNRGIGKTSLAFSSAQVVCKSDREPIYIACSPGMNFVSLLREVLIELSNLVKSLGLLKKISTKVEATLSASPALKFTWEAAQSTVPAVDGASGVVRLIRDFDRLLGQDASATVIILDELENIDHSSKGDAAYFVKQIGDQEVRLRFVYVGIAENIQQIIGEHRSSPRYLHEIQLKPLASQYIMDIAREAAEAVSVEIPVSLLYRISIISDGYPHFSHLMALHILTRCVIHGSAVVTKEMYSDGLKEAVKGSLEELAAIYEKATLRRDRAFERVLWTMAESDLVDQRIEVIVARYIDNCRALHWERENEETIQGVISKLRQEAYGSIIRNVTQKKAGEGKKVYGHVRFAESLMCAYVRLRAEESGIQIGKI